MPFENTSDMAPWAIGPVAAMQTFSDMAGRNAGTMANVRI